MGDFGSWLTERVHLMPEARCRTVVLYEDYMEHVGCNSLLDRVRRGLPGRKRFVWLLRERCGAVLLKSNGRSYAVGVTLKPSAGEGV